MTPKMLKLLQFIKNYTNLLTDNGILIIEDIP